jgi:hypothetical protein
MLLKPVNVLLLVVRIFRENVPILPYFVGEWIEPNSIESLSHPPNMLPDSPVFQPRKFATIKLTHYPPPHLKCARNVLCGWLPRCKG